MKYQTNTCVNLFLRLSNATSITAQKRKICNRKKSNSVLFVFIYTNQRTLSSIHIKLIHVCYSICIYHVSHRPALSKLKTGPATISILNIIRHASGILVVGQRPLDQHPNAFPTERFSIDIK